MPSFESAHLFVVALILLGIGLLAHLFYTLWRANRYSKTDLESMEAPAEELPCKAVGARLVDRRTDARRYELHYVLTFLTDDGEIKEFTVAEEVFLRYTTDQIGTLVTIDGEFFDFGDGEAI